MLLNRHSKQLSWGFLFGRSFQQAWPDFFIWSTSVDSALIWVNFYFLLLSIFSGLCFNLGEILFDVIKDFTFDTYNVVQNYLVIVTSKTWHSSNVGPIIWFIPIGKETNRLQWPSVLLPVTSFEIKGIFNLEKLKHFNLTIVPKVLQLNSLQLLIPAKCFKMYSCNDLTVKIKWFKEVLVSNF